MASPPGGETGRDRTAAREVLFDQPPPGQAGDGRGQRRQQRHGGAPAVHRPQRSGELPPA